MKIKINKNYNINDTDSILNDFKSNIKIHKNGELLENNYYINDNKNNYEKIENQNMTDQINPHDFFNNSLNGFLKNLK